MVIPTARDNDHLVNVNMSSSSFKRSDGVNKSTTIDVGAVWSSIQLPRKGAPMRGNYDHLGDAYTRNHVEAARWEISDR